MIDDDALIEMIRRSSNSQYSQAFPPLAESDVQEAERRLGFSLPPLLRRLYLEVSNGDFGVSCLPLILPQRDRRRYPSNTVVSMHFAPPSEEERASMIRAGVEYLAHWPEKVLIFADLGCGMFSCVDCSKPEFPVLYHDFNRDEDVFALEAPSLGAWLRGDGLAPWRSWGAALKIRFDEFEPTQAIADMTDEKGEDSDDAVLP